MILSTLDIKKYYKKSALIFLGVALFCIIFDLIYSIFSHGVRSLAMSLAFLYPLGLGGIVYFVLYWFPWYDKISNNLYNAAIATILLGSLQQGVNEISGADTLYYSYFFYLAYVLFGVSLLYGIFITLWKRKKDKHA